MAHLLGTVALPEPPPQTTTSGASSPWLACPSFRRMLAGGTPQSRRVWHAPAKHVWRGKKGQELKKNTLKPVFFHVCGGRGGDILGGQELESISLSCWVPRTVALAAPAPTVEPPKANPTPAFDPRCMLAKHREDESYPKTCTKAAELLFGHHQGDAEGCRGCFKDASSPQRVRALH